MPALESGTHTRAQTSAISPLKREFWRAGANFRLEGAHHPQSTRASERDLPLPPSAPPPSPTDRRPGTPGLKSDYLAINRLIGEIAPATALRWHARLSDPTKRLQAFKQSLIQLDELGREHRALATLPITQEEKKTLQERLAKSPQSIRVYSRPFAVSESSSTIPKSSARPAGSSMI